MNAKDYLNIEDILPEDAQVYRQYAEFLEKNRFPWRGGTNIWLRLSFLNSERHRASSNLEK